MEWKSSIHTQIHMALTDLVQLVGAQRHTEDMIGWKGADQWRLQPGLAKANSLWYQQISWQVAIGHNQLRTSYSHHIQQVFCLTLPNSSPNSPQKELDAPGKSNMAYVCRGGGERARTSWDLAGSHWIKGEPEGRNQFQPLPMTSHSLQAAYGDRKHTCPKNLNHFMEWKTSSKLNSSRSWVWEGFPVLTRISPCHSWEIPPLAWYLRKPPGKLD